MADDTAEAHRAIETKVYRYAGDWARDGQWEFTIHEYVHPTFIALGASFEEQRGIRWLVSEKIASLVAARVAGGLTIISADATSAYLKRPRMMIGPDWVN